MSGRKICLIAGAVCFGLAALGVAVPVLALVPAGFCFVTLAFLF